MPSPRLLVQAAAMSHRKDVPMRAGSTASMSRRTAAPLYRGRIGPGQAVGWVLHCPAMEPLGGIIKTRREELNLSQAELARAAGVHVRQIRRYESGEQQPVLAVAVKMAAALGVTLDELAGVAQARLEGDWWAAWEAGAPITSRPVQATQHGSAVRLEATRHDRPGWLWRGDLTLWDGQLLTGHYAGADGTPRSKGAMFFVLDADGDLAEGRRVGLSYDGAIVSGHAALARDRDAAHAIVERLIRAVPSGPGSPATP